MSNKQNQPSVPSTPPKLQPGRSSLYWYERAFKGSVGAFIGIILYVLVMYLLSPQSHVRFPLMLFVGGLTTIYTIVYLGPASVGLWKSDKRENKAGYTTTYDYRKRALWQLDPKTGEVIRRPGDPIPKRKR